MDNKLYEYLKELLEEEKERVESQPFCGTSEWAAQAYEACKASQEEEVDWAIKMLGELKNDIPS